MPRSDEGSIAAITRILVVAVLWLMSITSPLAAQSLTHDPPDNSSGPMDGCPLHRTDVSTMEHFQTFIYSVADWKTALAPAVSVAISQVPIGAINNGYPTNFGGYAEHYGTSILGNVTGKFFGNFLLPSIFRQDEQFQRMGPGPGNTLKERLWHVAWHTVWLGQGLVPVNVSALGGAGMNAFLSDAYLPDSQRTISGTAKRFGLNVGVSELGDGYTEFTPELKTLRNKIFSPFIPKKPQRHDLGLLLGQPPPIDFKQLSDKQQTLGQSIWPGLNGTEQLEFAGATQALDQWCAMDSSCKALTVQEPRLGFVTQVSGVAGQVPGAQSQDQYFVSVHWKPGAPSCFERANEWGPHFVLDDLHHNMFGYDQRKLSDATLGLVVLFDKHQNVVGQFHIDFKSNLNGLDPDSHFNADANSNIELNYPNYCLWYGGITAYIGRTCPSKEEELELALNFAPPPTVEAVPSPQVKPATRVEQAELRTQVEGLLSAWYVKRDFVRFAGFIAADNITASPIPSSGDSPWKESFDAAFTDPSSTEGVRSLISSISYHEGAQPKGTNKPRYLNSEGSGKPSDPFAIIDPDSLSSGSLLPSLPIVGNQSVSARFLAHLERDYVGRLYIVAYSAKDAHLVRTGVVQYWILEASGWKLADIRSID